MPKCKRSEWMSKIYGVWKTALFKLEELDSYRRKSFMTSYNHPEENQILENATIFQIMVK